MLHDSCIEVIEGCTDAAAFNFDTTANTDDNSCIEVIEGCTDATAFNFDTLSNIDDNSCEFDQTNTRDCILPSVYQGTTGSNMSVFMNQVLLSSLNATDENAYLVALTSSGLVVGSTSIYGLSQTSIALWSDDSQTPEIDGAVANEVISFQLVNGTDLYDVFMPSLLFME